MTTPPLSRSRAASSPTAHNCLGSNAAIQWADRLNLNSVGQAPYRKTAHLLRTCAQLTHYAKPGIPLPDTFPAAASEFGPLLVTPTQMGDRSGYPAKGDVLTSALRTLLLLGLLVPGPMRSAYAVFRRDHGGEPWATQNRAMASVSRVFELGDAAITPAMSGVLREGIRVVYPSHVRTRDRSHSGNSEAAARKAEEAKDRRAAAIRFIRDEMPVEVYGSAARRELMISYFYGKQSGADAALWPAADCLWSQSWRNPLKQALGIALLDGGQLPSEAVLPVDVVPLDLADEQEAASEPQRRTVPSPVVPGPVTPPVPQPTALAGQIATAASGMSDAERDAARAALMAALAALDEPQNPSDAEPDPPAPRPIAPTAAPAPAGTEDMLLPDYPDPPKRPSATQQKYNLTDEQYERAVAARDEVMSRLAKAGRGRVDNAGRVLNAFAELVGGNPEVWRARALVDAYGAALSDGLVKPTVSQIGVARLGSQRRGDRTASAAAVASGAGQRAAQPRRLTERTAGLLAAAAETGDAAAAAELAAAGRPVPGSDAAAGGAR